MRELKDSEGVKGLEMVRGRKYGTKDQGEKSGPRRDGSGRGAKGVTCGLGHRTGGRVIIDSDESKSQNDVCVCVCVGMGRRIEGLVERTGR